MSGQDGFVNSRTRNGKVGKGRRRRAGREVNGDWIEEGGKTG